MNLFSYRERHTPQSDGHGKGGVQQPNGAWLVFISWVISYVNEWEDYSNCLWEGAEISRIWATTHSLVLTVPWNCHGTPGCVISLAD